jgi:hypothetical protein
MCHKFFFEHGRISITKDEDVEWLQIKKPWLLVDRAIDRFAWVNISGLPLAA